MDISKINRSSYFYFIRHNNPMAKLFLKSVQCIVPDEIDKDEMYLKFNGEKIWPEGARYFRLDSGDHVAIDLTVEVPEGWVEIELWDFDYLSKNDFLGKFRFLVDRMTGDYSTSMSLDEDEGTASYVLNWEIL